jgi:PAS domain S-box-containing protein
MECFIPKIARPFTVRGTEVRPDDPPQLYLRKLARITLDEMLHLVGVLNTDGVLLECNRAALEGGGLTRADVIGKPLWESIWWSVTPKTQSDLREAISRAAAGEFVRYDVEVYARMSGSEIMVMDFTLLPVRDQEGRVVLLLFEGRDITDKKEQEREIARQREALGGLDELKAILRRFAEPKPELEVNPASGKPRILVAVDSIETRESVARILAGRFDVQLCNRDEALRTSREWQPDLIVSDAAEPGAQKLFNALVAEPDLREIPVIRLSDHAGDEGRVGSVEGTTYEYVVRPFHSPELLARAETHAKISRMRKEAQAAIRASEDRVKSFANAAPAILWITEPDAWCSFLSRGWYEYTGQSEQQALGFGWLNAVHPDDRHEASRLVHHANRNREAFTLDFRLRRADGQYRWAMSSGRPRWHPDGAFEGFTGSVIDIHERKQAARASALLSAIVDSSDDAIISKNLDGIIMSWNKSAERLFGYTADEAIGRSILMLIPPDRQDEEPGILARLRRGERVDHFETIRVRKDGSSLNISLTISPVRDPEGRIIGASKIARDITDRVRREQDLRDANAALQRANEDLQQFAYSASHDLQEPLRMVAAYSELLQKRFGGKLGPVADEYIGFTVAGAARMETLLRDLRTYTQVSTAEQLPPGEIDARAVLDKALANLEVAIHDAGATVRSERLPHVRMHEFQLQQLFQNLIGNAIRYRGTAPPVIDVSAKRVGDDWRFSVSDNGIGIEPEYKEQIFGIFKRLHSASDFPGTGMGLAICQRIVERGGGRIWVESEPGRGSTFYFTVPCAGSQGHREEALVHTADRG